MDLLLKAIRTLPEAEQDAVLRYLLERGPMSPAMSADPVFHGASMRRSSHTSARAAAILQMLAEGEDVAGAARQLGVDSELVANALRDVARRSRKSTRRAQVMAALADGRTIREIAGLSVDQVTAELSQDEVREALGATLLTRTQLPSLPSAQGPLRTVPVRFPERQHERLKQWCEAHDFPMAVVVRGLVEHFLDQQERRAA